MVHKELMLLSEDFYFSKNGVKRTAIPVPPQLMEHQMKAGLRVKIHPRSEYYPQSDKTGTITGQKDFASPWWRVEFDNGYSNAYRAFDLYLANYVNNKEATILLKKD